MVTIFRYVTERVKLNNDDFKILKTRRTGGQARKMSKSSVSKTIFQITLYVPKIYISLKGYTMI